MLLDNIKRNLRRIIIVSVVAICLSITATALGPEMQHNQITLGKFVTITAETLHISLFQSEKEMSALRYAYKSGWIESINPDVTISREQAADILVTASGSIIWPQKEVAFTDAKQISPKYENAVACAAKLGLVHGDASGTFRPRDALTEEEAGYLMERLKKIDTISFSKLFPEELKDFDIRYVGEDAILESGTARRVLAQVPQQMLQSFAAEGWTLYLTTEPIRTFYPQYPEATGLTDSKTKAVYVYVSSSFLYSSADTLLHEFGHFLQHQLGECFEREIKDAYEKEASWIKKVSGGSYGTKSDREFFAEAFRVYVQQGLANDVKIHDIIDKMLTSMIK